VGYHKGHRPSSIREPPVESATSITVQQIRDGDAFEGVGALDGRRIRPAASLQMQVAL